jgi:hypothetical protein
MRLAIDQEFLGICRRLLAEGRTAEAWAAVESDDQIQTVRYVGGFDATESAFCFSVYDEAGQERWFQLTLAEVAAVVEGTLMHLDARLPSE